LGASAKKLREDYNLRAKMKEENGENSMIDILHKAGLLLESGVPGK
jgi:hypothetical protein